jgi:hypothetical protein
MRAEVRVHSILPIFGHHFAWRRMIEAAYALPRNNPGSPFFESSAKWPAAHRTRVTCHLNKSERFTRMPSSASEMADELVSETMPVLAAL